MHRNTLTMLRIQPNEQLILQLLDAQPDSVVWFQPVFGAPPDEDQVVEFVAQYCNNAAARILGTSPDNVIGEHLRTSDLMDETSRNLIFKQCLQVWQSGEPVEFTYYSPAFDSYFQVQRSRVYNGVLSITRDRTKEVKAELEQRLQIEKFQHMVETADNGLMLLEPLRENGIIADFIISYCNLAGYSLGKLPHDCCGRKLTSVLPHLAGSQQMDVHKQVAITGEPVRYETAFRDINGNTYGWFIISLSRLGDSIVSRYIDITDKKQNELQLAEQTDLTASVLNASTFAIAAYDAVRNEEGHIIDFRYKKINEQYKQLFRKQEHEVIGRTQLEIFPSAVRMGSFGRYCQVMDTGLPARFEVHYRADGLNAWFEVSSVKVGENGMVCTFLDISERKQQLAETEKQQLLLNNILAYSANGISVSAVLRDEHGTPVDCMTILANDAAVKFTGLPKEVYLSQPATSVEPNIIRSPYFQMCLKVLETGEPAYTEYRTESTQRWLEISISRMDEDHFITVFTDVTPKKEAQLKMESLVEELKKSNTNLEEFAYSASHDLQEPLRKIHYFSNRLKHDLSDTLTLEHSRMFERMEGSSERMRGLIEDLLAYSRVSYKPDQRKQVSLDNLVQLVIQDFENEIQEKDAIIEVSPLPAIYGDEGQMRQVFQNLIGNSLKYRKSDQRPHIRIDCVQMAGNDPHLPTELDGRPSGYYCIAVRDNGVGFDQEHAEKIFKVFQRLVGRSEYEGNGIGLSIVQKVVKNHQGLVTAKGETNRGATFEIYLPV